MPFKNACKRSQQQCDPRNISTATVARPPENQTRTVGRGWPAFHPLPCGSRGVNTVMFVFAGAIDTHWSDCTALLGVQYPFVLFCYCISGNGLYMVFEYFSTYSCGSLRALYITAVLVQGNLESWIFVDELETSIL